MENIVQIRVPEFDIEKCDSRNILGIILEVDEDKDLYEIGTKDGLWHKHYYDDFIDLEIKHCFFYSNVVWLLRIITSYNVRLYDIYHISYLNWILCKITS